MTTTPLVSHPIANAYPSMTDAEFNALRESIKKNGVRNPIVIYENMILDGRHRYLACKELGIEPPTMEFEGDACPVEYVRDINSNRRSLTASQRAAVALALMPLIEVEAKKRQARSTEVSPDAKGKSSEIAAKATGASPRMVEAVKSVAKKKPELVEKIKTGEMTVAQAEQEIEQEEEPIASNASDPIEDILKDIAFSTIDKAIATLIRDVAALGASPSGKHMNMQQINASLKEARQAVKFARPHCRCTYKSCDANCPVCKGEGWITKALLERIPKD